MKIKFWTYTKNLGDGSVGVRFYKTKEEAKAASDKDMEAYGENYCEDVAPHEFEVDKFGQVLKGFHSNED